MKHHAANPPIVPCPGLKVTRSSGVFFTDCLKRVYDLEKEKTLRPKEAAADERLCGTHPREILRLVRAGKIYPVMRLNARTILIFDCALTDWRARQLGGASRRFANHLFVARATKVA